jgi:hypothetical protein
MEDYRRRYTVERSVAWMGNFQRLLIRWQHLPSVYAGFFTVAVLVICVRVYERLLAAHAASTPPGGQSGGRDVRWSQMDLIGQRGQIAPTPTCKT